MEPAAVASPCHAAPRFAWHGRKWIQMVGPIRADVAPWCMRMQMNGVIVERGCLKSRGWWELLIINRRVD